MEPNTLKFPEPIHLKGNHSPLSVWLEVHSANQFWAKTYVQLLDTPRHSTALRIVEDNRETAISLSSFPVERWKNVCNGFGWTTIAASLLSWCAGATLEDVLDFWRSKQIFPERGIGHDFPALLINPQLLPGDSLTDIIRTGKDEIGVLVILASKMGDIDIDVSKEKLSILPADLRQMIESRSNSDA